MREDPIVPTQEELEQKYVILRKGKYHMNSAKLIHCNITEGDV